MSCHGSHKRFLLNWCQIKKENPPFPTCCSGFSWSKNQAGRHLKFPTVLRFRGIENFAFPTRAFFIKKLSRPIPRLKGHLSSGFFPLDHHQSLFALRIKMFLWKIVDKNLINEIYLVANWIWTFFKFLLLFGKASIKSYVRWANKVWRKTLILKCIIYLSYSWECKQVYSGTWPSTDASRRLLSSPIRILRNKLINFRLALSAMTIANIRVDLLSVINMQIQPSKPAEWRLFYYSDVVSGS